MSIQRHGVGVLLIQHCYDIMCLLRMFSVLDAFTVIWVGMQIYLAFICFTYMLVFKKQKFKKIGRIGVGLS